MNLDEKDFLERYDAKPNRSFEMFTKAGDKRCQAITRKAIRKIFGAKKITREELLKFIGAEIKKVAVKHEEITDSEPPYHIQHYIGKACEIAQYDFEIDSYDVTDFAF